MGQTDNGSVFGGLTQMVVPAGAPPTPAAPPPPSFDHLNTIQVAPSTSKNTGGASGSWGDTIGPSKSADKTEVHQLSPGEQPNPNYDPLGGIKEGIDKITSEIENYDQQGRGEHPVLAQLGDAIRNAKELLYGGQEAGKPLGTHSGVINNPVSQSIMMAPGAAEAGAAAEEKAGEVAGKVGNKVIDALSHPTEGIVPAEGNPEAGAVRVHKIDPDVRDAALKHVQDKVQAKGAVQQADRAGAEDLANRQPYVAPQREPNYVYRSRDIGEQGVPANENSHAQLTSSEDQARLYTQPGQRDAVTGKPQELVRIDLNKLRPSDYSTKKMDEGVNWHKLKRDVPEELVEKMPVDYHAIGKQQGVDFRGVQEGYGVTSDVAIFQDPQSGTSVGVPLEKWSPKTLAEHIAQARQRMAGTSNKPSLLGKQ